MAIYSSERSVGARVAAARRTRGFRTTRDLAAAMEGTGVTTAVLENIESGRKANLEVSQLLNIARTLRVPVSSLLAPVSRPGDKLDLPSLGPGFDGMTASEFDSWLCAVPNADYVARSSDERAALAELQALREYQTMRRELRRQLIANELEAQNGRSDVDADRAADRIAQTETQVSLLHQYLLSAGWDLQEPVDGIY